MNDMSNAESKPLTVEALREAIEMMKGQTMVPTHMRVSVLCHPADTGVLCEACKAPAFRIVAGCLAEFACIKCEHTQSSPEWKRAVEMELREVGVL